MTTIAIGSRFVHRARLHVPWVGRWVLRAWFDGEPPTGKVTVQWGNTQVVGTVLPDKSGSTVGEGVATIVGGVGWHNEPPANWLINVAAAPANVVQQLAQAVGETIVLSAGALRPGRVAYARAKQPASETLRDLLADDALWWVDFGGTTRAGTDRPSPSLSAELVLEHDPEARIAKLDILEPSQAPVGGVIPAASERFPELRIYAIDIEASEAGVLTTARTERPVADVPHVAALLEKIVARAPLPPHATWRTATVQSQDAQRRLSVRFEERDKELDDMLPVRSFSGVPGVSAEVFGGTRTLIAFDRADPTNPIAALWSPFGETGHVPRKVYHEAAEEIRLFGNSAGILHIGPASPTPPVAIAVAPMIDQLNVKMIGAIGALETFGIAVEAYAAAVAVVLPVTAPAAATLAAAKTALSTTITGLIADMAALAAPYPTGYHSVRSRTL